MLSEFTDSGVNLPEDKRKRVIKLNQEIEELAREARSNIDEDKSRIEVDVKELVRLNKDHIKKLERSDKQGFVWLPLKSTAIDALLSISLNEEFRKKLRTAKDSILKDKNPKILE